MPYGLSQATALGMGVQPPRQQSKTDAFLQKLMLGLTGTDDRQAQQQALMALGSGLLQASGPSEMPISLGQALGGGMQAAQAAGQQSQENAMRRMLIEKQMEQMSQKSSPVRKPLAVMGPDGKPMFVAEQDAIGHTPWSLSQGQPAARPSDIEVFEYYDSLPPDKKKEFLNTKRQPPAPVFGMVNGVPTIIDRTDKTTTPLSTLESEAGAAATKAEAEANAKIFGQMMGEAKGGIAKKGVGAQNVNNLLDLAEPLIEVATGSTAGATADKVAAFFGKSTSGAQATARLKTLQAAIMFAQPRMEGPQGVADVILYEKAAGDIANDTLPRETRLAAVKTIRDLQTKYMQAAGVPPAQSPVQPPSSGLAVGQSRKIGKATVTREN